jgi:hypothetical protein
MTDSRPLQYAIRNTQYFSFSQHNLQDYADCPRRFELRFVLRRQWPALQSEPVLEIERRAELGRRFHEMVYQSNLGIAADQILASTNDPELCEWWNEYLGSPILAELPNPRRAEFTLSAPFEGQRLLAKYDLLAVEPGGRAIIVDWKTSGKPLARGYLANRLQTRVYPFLLVEAGHALNGGQPIQPEQVEMIYWYPSEPANPLHFHYSRAQYQADREYLAAMLREIAARKPGEFPLTADLKKCAYCVYRSLCNRGTQAGSWDENEEDLPAATALEIPFEQIGEIEF